MADQQCVVQAELVASFVHLEPVKKRSFERFRFFRGVFPVDPWKPDSRQIAQQAQFLCAADLTRSFMDNLSAHDFSDPEMPGAVFTLVLSSDLREEVLERLAMMNVTAANLFPDLNGLAMSLRTLPMRRNPARPDFGKRFDGVGWSGPQESPR